MGAAWGATQPIRKPDQTGNVRWMLFSEENMMENNRERGKEVCIKVDRFWGVLLSTFKKPTLNKVRLRDMPFNRRNSSTLLLAEKGCDFGQVIHMNMDDLNDAQEFTRILTNKK